MTPASDRSLLSSLLKQALSGDAGNVTDGQLLDWFLAHKEETAFRALLHRHGPMVMGVCRRVLNDAHDAEDAFQATFLVLVRKAASIVPRNLVANWLFGVAYRTAQKARVTRARVSAAKRRMQEKVTVLGKPHPTEDEIWHDLQPVLDQELKRLPDKYRTAIILCDLERKSRKEAARQLGWPEGTLSGRLARARKLLAKRLTQRGITLSVAALGAVLTGRAVPAAVPAALKSNLTQAALLSAGGKAVPAGIVSAKAIAVMEGVMKSMLLNKLKIGALLLVAFGFALTGMGSIAHRVAAAMQQRPQADRAESSKVVRAEPIDDKADLADAEMHIIGVYGPKNDVEKDSKRVNVEVRPTAKPVVLVLTSYFSVDWHIKLADGARIQKVIVSGYNDQEIKDLPAGVPAINQSYFPSDGSRRKAGWFYAYQWNTPQWREVVRRLNEMTGLPVASFQE